MFKKQPFKLQLQRFNDGETQQQQTQAPPTTTTTTQTQAPEGKTFSEDYVKTLREESKAHRLAGKAYETHLRTLLGLNPEDEIGEKQIKAFQTAQTKLVSDTMAKANARLLSAEIKSLDGYDAKLVERLLDKTKVTIDENGVVTGLTEAVAALEVEFPSIKIGSTQSGGGSNPANAAGGDKTELDSLIEQYNAATNTATKVLINQKIHALRKKQ